MKCIQLSTNVCSQCAFYWYKTGERDFVQYVWTACCCPASPGEIFTPAAGQCRTSGMCKKKVPEQLKVRGEPELLVLYPSPRGNRIMSRWQRHLALRIPHKESRLRARAKWRGLGGWNRFISWYLTNKSTSEKDNMNKNAFPCESPVIHFLCGSRLQCCTYNVRKKTNNSHAYINVCMYFRLIPMINNDIQYM